VRSARRRVPTYAAPAANGNGIVTLTPSNPITWRCQLVWDDFRDLSTAIARGRPTASMTRRDPEEGGGGWVGGSVVDVAIADPDLTRAGAKAPVNAFHTVDYQELARAMVLCSRCL